MLQNTLKHHLGSIGLGQFISLRNHFHNFGTSKQCIQARNTSFASFDVQKVWEMLLNTLKYHLGSSGVEWLISLRNHFRNFGTPKQCIYARNTSFASFDVPKVCEMLRNTLKHRLGSSRGEWLISLGNYFRNFGTPKQCIESRNTSFASFDVLKVG